MRRTRYPNLLMLLLTVSLVRRTPDGRPALGDSGGRSMKFAVPGAHPWRRAHNLVAVAATIFATTALSAQVVFHVSLGQASATSVSGRLLVFAKPLGPADKRPVTV